MQVTMYSWQRPRGWKEKRTSCFSQNACSREIVELLDATISSIFIKPVSRHGKRQDCNEEMTRRFWSKIPCYICWYPMWKTSKTFRYIFLLISSKMAKRQPAASFKVNPFNLLFCHKTPYIFIINAILLPIDVVEIYALFLPIFLGWQIVSANFFAFCMYGLYRSVT